MLMGVTNRPCLCGIVRCAHHNLRQRTTQIQTYHSNRRLMHGGTTWVWNTTLCRRLPPMDRKHLQMTASQHLSSSATLSAPQEEITFETILSDENKRQCQARLLNVKPVREFKWQGKSTDIEKAAVLVLLCMVNGKPSILFTERSNQLYMHRGEISFPGGKADDTDLHLSHTALREAEEEIGLCREKVDIWGEMLPVPGRKFNITITPVVACYSGELDLSSLKLNRHEVESVFAPSIETLCHADNNYYTCFRAREMMTKGTLKKYREMSTSETFTLPVYVAGNRRIWGLTAIVLHQVLRLTAGGLYKSKLGSLDLQHKTKPTST